ncbi:MAG: hypothetical protein ACD_79C01145G0001 [uncultured bacterium]|nr:MAG: hypothetical protein ACD_79C01145G0001 [uncultured bacterium]
MSWKNVEFSFPFDIPSQMASRPGSASLNEQCFIRKQHKCGKMYGASKSCFIACPTNDDLEPILGLISEKLTKLGIEPIIAVKERAYGQDIFCTKICGKIIESRFCIVILDDTIKLKTNIPNPNVYYEYGLMTSLRKHIIPLQKENLELAFNIQSYDTIKYNLKNVGVELDRAIRDAVKLTETKEPEKTPEAVADKVFLRKMEMAGLEAKDEKWILANVINDTAFRGFGQHEKIFYSFVGKIDNHNDMKTYLDDLSVALYRTEKKVKETLSELEEFKKQFETKKKEDKSNRRESFPNIMRESRNFSSLEEKIYEFENRLNLMATIYIAFIIAPDQNATDFIRSASTMLSGHDRYRLTYSHDGKIEFGDIIVDFTSTQQEVQ